MSLFLCLWGYSSYPRCDRREHLHLATNDLETYTDQAKEFNPDNAGFHPVIEATNDNLTVRNITGGNPWLTPFGAVGNQTMYCSDCHGKDTLGTGENSPSPSGPHGSENEFVLLGKWDFNTGTQNATNGIDGDLCFKCHDPDVYFACCHTGLYMDRFCRDQQSWVRLICTLSTWVELTE